jgi:predicted RNA-binding Zn-ribbon protein involved in translation (DUF1610 family)
MKHLLDNVSGTTTALWNAVNKIYGNNTYSITVSGSGKVFLERGFTTEIIAEGNERIQTVLRKLINHTRIDTDQCPRCGLPQMDPKRRRNALSRVGNVYVCETCGMDEALRAVNGLTVPADKWPIK